MKKLFVIFISISMLGACNSNSGESGVVNDGIKAVDSNGALSDSPGIVRNPSTDTSIGDDRVDTEKRDSLNQH